MSHVVSLALAPEEEAREMEQMGEYLVRRLIGEGGMGKVYEAEERLSKRRVALKVLHGELSKSDTARRLFLNEMQILARIEHPQIVRSLASIEVSGELVMVLEYLEGHTLRRELYERERLACGEAVRIVADVARALSAAHGMDPPIIHRDLKPENIMVLEGGGIKVMDFGIAKVMEAMNQTNTQSVGTLQYMSPEQIDAHTIDHRSDLYCLGLVLFELLEGQPPFTSQSPRQLLNLQCTADPPSLSPQVRQGLPKGVEDLLYHLLEKAPEDRPYLAEDVLTRLEPFLPAASAPTRNSAAASPRNSAAASPRNSAAASPRNSAAASPRGRVSLALSPETRDASAVRASSEDSGPRTLETPEPVSLPQARISRESAEPGRAASAGHGANAAHAASAAAGATRPSEGDEEVVRPPMPRADTIALLDRAPSEREVPTSLAVAIIVVMSVLAGAAAYAIRATSQPAGDSSAAPGKTAPEKTTGSTKEPGSTREKR